MKPLISHCESEQPHVSVVTRGIHSDSSSDSGTICQITQSLVQVQVVNIEEEEITVFPSSVSSLSVSFPHSLGDVLQPLLQHLEAGPSSGIQVPALFHDVVHHFRAAFWTVHLVALLHSRHYVL